MIRENIFKFQQISTLMGLKARLGLTAFLLFCPINLPNKIPMEATDTLSEVKLYKVSSLEELIEKKRGVYHISENDVLKKLTTIANNNEFLLTYFPEYEMLINTGLLSKVDTAMIDTALLHQLSYAGKFRVIHNHNGIGINDPNIPLYWIGVSPSDVNQYLIFGKMYPKMDYSIVNKYGMLTMTTDSETFKYYENPAFKNMVYDVAEHMQYTLTGMTPDSLTAWASNYNGILRLKFERP
jgi:hypothetical protein